VIVKSAEIEHQRAEQALSRVRKLELRVAELKAARADVERLRVEAQRVPALVDLVEELVPLIGTHYDVPDLLELADDLTGDAKGESKEGGA
jgi:hypothetical protein